MPLILTLLFAAATQCPMHAQHAAVDERHDTLGVSHTTATHTFRDLDDGGAIELHANDAGDAETVAAIRKHLRTIQKEFAAGDFSTPKFVHDKVPDGVPEMKRLHDRIAYRYEELSDGARVRITTTDGDAIGAVHAFLRFQRSEHKH